MRLLRCGIVNESFNWGCKSDSHSRRADEKIDQAHVVLLKSLHFSGFRKAHPFSSKPLTEWQDTWQKDGRCVPRSKVRPLPALPLKVRPGMVRMRMCLQDFVRMFGDSSQHALPKLSACEPGAARCTKRHPAALFYSRALTSAKSWPSLIPLSQVFVATAGTLTLSLWVSCGSCGPDTRCCACDGCQI